MANKRGLAFSLAALLILILGAFVLAQPGKTEATLVVSDGEAIVNQAGGAIFAGMAETAVSTGDIVTVSEGDTIRLTENGAAQLRLQDGSTVDIFGGSTVTVSELVMDEESYRFQLNLLTGKTLSRVVRLLRPNDAFEIRTPSSTASVRGTVFSVEAQTEDSTHVLVEEGIVRVALENGDSVDIPAGFQVTAVVGQPLQTEPNNAPTATPTSTPTETPTDAPTETPTDEPTDTPEPDDSTPNDPPEGVPGNTPDEVPGEGDPPDAGGTPPGQVDDPDDSDDGQADKVVICHYPGGDTSKGNTIEVDADALDAHLAHGDTLGPCPLPTEAPTNTAEPAPTNTAVPAPTNTPVPAPTDTPDSGGKVTICHNGNTIEVNADAVDAHLAHGDTLGSCP